MKPADLQRTFTQSGLTCDLQDSKRWIQQSEFASKGDWSRLEEWQLSNPMTVASDADQNNDCETTDTVGTTCTTGSTESVESTCSTGSQNSQDSQKSGDDLTRINGIGPATAKMLRENGITRFSQLDSMTDDRLNQLMENAGPRFRMLNWSTWRQQAGFASQGDWTGLNQWFSRQSAAVQEELEQAGSAESNGSTDSTGSTGSTYSTGSQNSQVSQPSGDDLTRINGIGPATAEMLRENGITRFSQLVSIKEDRLEQLMESAGPRFRMVNWSTWNKQAGFAAKGDWNGLGQWFNRQSKSVKEELAQASIATGGTDVRSQASASNGVSVSTGASNGTPQDLTRIHGIGPATAKLLKRNGITRFEQLASVDQSWLENLMTTSGSKFSLVNWQTWSQQARFAVQGDWDGLKSWSLENSNDTNSNSKRSGKKSGKKGSVQFAQATPTGKPDKLTLINGIGPATAKILKSNGVTRFEQVASMSGKDLEKMFANSGARFQLVDPTNWPQQAIEILQKSGRVVSDCSVESGLLQEISDIQSLTTSKEQPAAEQTQSVDR